MVFALSVSAQEKENYNATLWYEYPAEDWKTQALHIGNGYMGASFYGGVKEERFDITEETVWFGGPGQNPNYNYGIVEGSNAKLGDIRKAIVDGDIKKADKLVSKNFVGDYSDFGVLTSLEQLYFSFENHEGKATNYKRKLDVSKALATVSYNLNGVQYTREYFASYPDRVIGIHFESSVPGKLGFSIHRNFTQKENEVTIKDNEIHVQGKIDGNNRNYEIRIKVLHDGGEITNDNGRLKLSGATSETVLYTTATECLPIAPLYNGANPEKITKKLIKAAAKKGYDQLKKEHVADYTALYDRTSLEMDGDPLLEKLPTNERFEMLKTGMTDDAGLKVLLFNLGKYLLLSASREGTLPLGLQGVWVSDIPAAWAGNYQSNINLQEMYWTAGPLNLPEAQEAYINWIKTLVGPGRKVAKAYYGTDGWVSHTTGNIWGFASPGADMLWGMYPSGAAWHCQHLWSQYEYTQDKDYLRDEAYPVMKEATQF
nr:glycoside hydrolase N-terminal domain-containing protein [Allomuricauda onchidii]